MAFSVGENNWKRFSSALQRQAVYGTIKYGLYYSIKDFIGGEESTIKNLNIAIVSRTLSASIVLRQVFAPQSFLILIHRTAAAGGAGFKGLRPLQYGLQLPCSVLVLGEAGQNARVGLFSSHLLDVRGPIWRCRRPYGHSKNFGGLNYMLKISKCGLRPQQFIGSLQNSTVRFRSAEKCLEQQPLPLKGT